MELLFVKMVSGAPYQQSSFRNLLVICVALIYAVFQSLDNGCSSPHRLIEAHLLEMGHTGHILNGTMLSFILLMVNDTVLLVNVTTW